MSIADRVIVVAFAVVCGFARAAEVSEDDVRTAVAGWIALGEPLGGGFVSNTSISGVAAYPGEGGKGKFYCVSFSGGGYVLTTSDTDTVPVAAYSAEGVFEATDDNPLYCLMVRDAAARAARLEAAAQAASAASATGRAGAGAAANPNAAAWARLKSAAASGRASAGAHVSSPSTVLVSPLLATKWGQQTTSAGNCYNYYTPNHYPCGCVATAGGQVMKYFAWPKTDVEAKTFACKVDGAATALTMKGGTYEWSKMVPSGGDGNRAAVGKLCYDVGVSVGMEYASSGSGAVTMLLANSFTNAFGYSNACFIGNGSGITREEFEKTVLCNLYAKRPCVLAVLGYPTGDETKDAGHAVVADGYGLSGTTAYTHLNMGWSGGSDTWYTPVWADDTTGLADIDAGKYVFTNIHHVVFNIFTNDTKLSSIACGRITDTANGNAPVYGATVTAKAGGVVKATAKTDSKGVYALILPPTDRATTYTLTAEAEGYVNNQSLQVKARMTAGVWVVEYKKDGIRTRRRRIWFL